MYTGCYTLDLYCDQHNPTHGHMQFPMQYMGHTEAECLRSARKAGWIFTRKRQLCPKCNLRKKAAT